MYTCKDIAYTLLKILSSMSQFSGLWKHTNNPTCTESVKLQTVCFLRGTQATKKTTTTCANYAQGGPAINRKKKEGNILFEIQYFTIKIKKILVLSSTTIVCGIHD